MIWPIISKDSFISYNSMSNFYAPAIPTVPLIPLSLCIGTASLERPIYNNFIYFWLCWVFVAPWAFLQLWGAGATLQSQPVGFSLWWLLSLWRTCSTVCRLSSCGFWALECRLESWRMGFVAPQHVRSSRTRDQSCVSCIGQQIFVFTTELPGKPQNACFTSDHLANSISLIRDMLIYSVSKYLLSVFLGTMIDTGYYFFSVTLLQDLSTRLKY